MNRTPEADLVEFTPQASLLLAERLLGADKVVFLRTRQVAPRFKEVLEVVRLYR